MRAFGTEYTAVAGNLRHTSTSRVWARDEDHAREVMAARGLGEKMANYVDTIQAMASELFESAMARPGTVRVSDVMHAGIWLAHLQVSSGGLVEMLSDAGWLHRMIHWLDTQDRGGSVDGWQRVLGDIQAAEMSVPGLLP